MKRLKAAAVALGIAAGLAITTAPPAEAGIVCTISGQVYCGRIIGYPTTPDVIGITYDMVGVEGSSANVTQLLYAGWDSRAWGRDADGFFLPANCWANTYRKNVPAEGAGFTFLQQHQGSTSPGPLPPGDGSWVKVGDTEVVYVYMDCPGTRTTQWTSSRPYEYSS